MLLVVQGRKRTTNTAVEEERWTDSSLDLDWFTMYPKSCILF